ncbi:MAG: hypothetical protein M3345_07080 [Actinomycetota bacterium]|nr:hypothetical protein [Actinomycetota bacterium]
MSTDGPHNRPHDEDLLQRAVAELQNPGLTETEDRVALLEELRTGLEAELEQDLGSPGTPRR